MKIFTRARRVVIVAAFAGALLAGVPALASAHAPAAVAADSPPGTGCCIGGAA